MALDLIKCLKLVELKRLRITCAPLNELPSNISTLEELFHLKMAKEDEKRKEKKGKKTHIEKNTKKHI